MMVSVSVDKRGQILLPKDLREKAEIKAGDRFVLISGEREGEICCILLIKEELYEKKGSDNPPKSIMNCLICEQLGWGEKNE